MDKVIKLLEENNALLRRIADALEKRGGRVSDGTYKLIGMDDVNNNVIPIDERESLIEINELAEDVKDRYDHLFVIMPNGKKRKIK
jgi:hypothetical protein